MILPFDELTYVPRLLLADDLNAEWLDIYCDIYDSDAIGGDDKARSLKILAVSLEIAKEERGID